MDSFPIRLTTLPIESTEGNNCLQKLAASGSETFTKEVKD